MFDWDNIYKKYMDRTMLYAMELAPDMGKGFKSFLDFLAYKFFPFILRIVSYIILFYIMNTVYNKYGIERVIIVIGVILILKKGGSL
jgi:hypothetical protein